jgi:hypothetical protein
MFYIIAVTILLAILSAYLHKKEIRDLKKIGIRVPGLIIFNDDGSVHSIDGSTRTRKHQLGGNFNEPRVRFVTADGKVITGKPVIGFISQKEVKVPRPVYIYYNPENPEEFCLDL